MCLKETLSNDDYEDFGIQNDQFKNFRSIEIYVA